MQYFIDTVVDSEPDYWYGFIDDDNRILDDTFLYEIPVYEAQGYRALNPVLKPRLGRSVCTFLADHIRYTDDITIYRLFTGVLGRPYLGFHGELLCARGDVLREIGFDRQSIVEDFAYALELAREDIPVWQSETTVSILSPHDLTSFLKQRTRWYVGVAKYLPHAPLLSQVVVGTRILVWSIAITSSWIFMPLWLLGVGISLSPLLIALLVVGTALYTVTIGFGAYRIGGVKGAALMLLTPFYAFMEHVVPLYAVLMNQDSFVVIDK